MRRGRWRSSLIITRAIKRSSSRDAVSIAGIQEEESVQNCPRSTLTTQRWPSVNRSTYERYFTLDLHKLVFKRYWLSELQTKEAVAVINYQVVKSPYDISNSINKSFYIKTRYIHDKIYSVSSLFTIFLSRIN